MKQYGCTRKKIIQFLAVPLIMLSAVRCLTAVTGWLPEMNFSLAGACLFACVIASAQHHCGIRKTVLYTALTALLCYSVMALCSSLLPPAAVFFKGRYILFGAAEQLLSLFCGSGLTQRMYHTDVTGAVITDSGIVSGIADIFAAEPQAPSHDVSRYMAGAYLTVLFLPFGITAALWKRAGKRGKALLVSGVITAWLTGDARFFLLTSLILFPLSLAAYAAVSALAYWCCSLLDIRIGFTVSPSVTELVRYIRSPLIFLLIGVALMVLLYFACLYLLARRTKRDNEENDDESA